MTVTVLNRAPIYSPISITSYPSVSMHLFETKTVTVPAFIDPDGSGALGASLDVADPVAPFLTFTFTTNLITLTPTNYNEVGTHTLNVKIYD